jgi:hypothetical protein
MKTDMPTPLRRTPSSPVDLDALARVVTASDFDQQPPAMTPTTVIQSPAPDIGKLSADAVLEQYKMAAQSVEAMGDEVQKRIRALEAAMKECDDDMKLLKDAAEAIMEKGKHAHAEIERTTAVSKDIREIVAAIKTKLT